MSTKNYPAWDREYAAQRNNAGPKKGQLLRQDVYKSNSEVFHTGGYTCESGKVVEYPIDDPMLGNTIVYSNPFDVSHVAVRCAETATSVVNNDCILVAKVMIDRGLNPCVMNLADAYTACGMYKRGSRAQEEHLCRTTTLSRSLFQFFKGTTKAQAQYSVDANVEVKSIAYPMDMNYGGIYTPDATVFRNAADLFSFLEEPFKIAVVSVAALDFNEKHGKNLEYKAADGSISPEGIEIMKNKIRTIYRVALANGHDSLVAGAFGCGAFRLSPATVSSLFHEVLNEVEFKNKFIEVVFAILDKDGEKGKFAPFYQQFNK